MVIDKKSRRFQLSQINANLSFIQIFQLWQSLFPCLNYPIQLHNSWCYPIKKYISITKLCSSNQHVKYRMPSGFPLTSSLLLNYHVKHTRTHARTHTHTRAHTHTHTQKDAKILLICLYLMQKALFSLMIGQLFCLSDQLLFIWQT